MNRQEERRKDYESPRTRMVQVETEGNLCGSATVRNPAEGDNARIESHKVNEDFNYNFTNNDWDTTPQSQQ